MKSALALDPTVHSLRAYPKIVDRILDALRPAQRVCIVGHIRPDGDCVGSQLGLALALRAEGKSVACWNEDCLPEKLRFLDRQNLIQKPQPGHAFETVVALDSASLGRLGSTAACIAQRDLLINIDHHASNTRYGDVNWVSAREPSTGELVYRLLKIGRYPITPAIADCLFTAISTDTGSFQYPSTRAATFHLAGELVARGADVGRICHEVYQSYPLSRVRLVKHLYNRFRLTHRDQTAYFWLRQRDYQRTGAVPCDSEGLIDHIRAIEPVVVACAFEELELGLTRVSLRSKSNTVDVNQIAAQFGGGGHPAAAGARVRGSAVGVQRRVLAAIKKALNSRPS